MTTVRLFYRLILNLDQLIVRTFPTPAEAGYFVAKIRSADADSGYNALLSYHLTDPKERISSALEAALEK